MCRPSSSADAPGDAGDWTVPHVALPGAEQFILHHADLLGPCAEWFVRTLWAQAAQNAYQDSVQLLEHAYRYTPQRLERACQLAFVYSLDSLPGSSSPKTSTDSPYDLMPTWTDNSSFRSPRPIRDRARLVRIDVHDNSVIPANGSAATSVTGARASTPTGCTWGRTRRAGRW